MFKHTIDVAKKMAFPLPAFAYYTPEDWKNLKKDEIELVENMLGWDITDFGSGDFNKIGLTIFTFRNGNFYAKDQYPTPPNIYLCIWCFVCKYICTPEEGRRPHYRWL